MWTFLVENKIPLLFYLGLILLIVIFKRKFEWQGILGLYKSQVGVPLMKTLSTKYREFFRWFGYVGIGVGFVGMLTILGLIIKGLYDLFLVPGAPATISPVIPGFEIPGTGIAVPLFTGWIALFVVVMIHEFSHGVVSKSHDIPIKSSGILFVGPLMGAFVEPDEKKLTKSSDVVQYSVYAAGPFSNVVLALVVLLVMSLVSAPILGTMTHNAGVEITSVNEGSPAENALLPEGAIIERVNGELVGTTTEFVDKLEFLMAGELVTLATPEGEEYAIVAEELPGDTRRGQLGINIVSVYEPAQEGFFYKTLYNIVSWINKLFIWIVLLSLGLGLANLLPLGPVDGGRMLHTMMTKFYGEDRGVRYWKLISKITGIIIIVLLIVPIFRAVIA